MGTIGIIAAIIAAVASLGTGLMSYRSQKKANEFNQQQYEDWKSYNTPSSQMERLGEAGLNPYMVNGVNNTLSQPFAIGQNTGLAEMFSNIAGNFNKAGNLALKEEGNQISWMNAHTRKIEASIHDRLANLRERMVILAEKRNDPIMALLWGQADAQTIGNSILRRSEDSIVKLRQYQAALNEQQYNFLDKMNPMKLSFYAPMQRAKINSMLASANLANRQASHLDWLEPFQTNQFLSNYSLNYKRYLQSKLQFELGQENFYDRLGLSSNYFDLAVDKYWKDLLYDMPFWNFLGKAPLKKVTKGGAGQFPSWTEYDYGY